MGYNFTARWIKGALNNVPGALSCHPVTDPMPGDLHTEHDPDGKLPLLGAQESIWLELCRHADHDCCYRLLHL